MILALTSPVIKTNSNGYCTSTVLDTNLVYLTCNIVLELMIYSSLIINNDNNNSLFQITLTLADMLALNPNLWEAHIGELRVQSPTKTMSFKQ